MPLFDAYVIVDWSTSSRPNPVWLTVFERDGACGTEPGSPATCTEAMDLLAERLSDLVARGRRVLVGVNCALGVPAGIAACLAPREPTWAGVWKALNAKIHFDDNSDAPAQPRQCERGAPQAESIPVQALPAIPHMFRLRRHPWFGDVTRVWPFETGLKALSRQDPGQIILAEVTPSLLPVAELARHFSELDRLERLAELFAGDPTLSDQQRAEVEQEEGWILGVVGEIPHDYLRDPQAIYAASWEAIRRECDLSRLPAELTDIALRVVHACGMPEVADALVCSPGAVEAGRTALQVGAPVLVDVEMVAHGIIRRLLPAGNDVICTLNAPEVPELARSLGTTRSAAAVELWRERLGGAVVAIGNAPTALFHLLERLEAGWPKPALVLGFPVGFVGAVESKQALALNRLAVPFIALHGRRGGSAMAAAAVNALAGGVA